MPTIHNGVVTSIGKMAKTVTVTVDRNVEVPKVLKVVRRSTKYLVHDENHVSHVGDKVTIIDGITYSLRKHFRLHTIDRRRKDPAQFAQKPREWTALELRARAAETRRLGEIAQRQKKAAMQSQFAERYARRIQQSGEGFADAAAAALAREAPQPDAGIGSAQPGLATGAGRATKGADQAVESRESERKAKGGEEK